MEKYVHEGDWEIMRSHPDHEGHVLVIDCDGEILLRTPDDKWSDDQIRYMMGRINCFYGVGYKDGEINKVNEIKKSLFIK